MTYDNKSSADLEREVQQQRDRVEQRIGEIKDRLSPGQLLDEALSYTKHGGSQFAGNLGHQISANPLPAALVGVGVAWLMAGNLGGGQGNAHAASGTSSHADDYPSYPYANVKSGGLKRVSHAADDTGEWWSEFQSTSGQRFKAKSNEFGQRAGHFTDEAGKAFSGFIDEAGNRVHEFQDEAGNRLGDAQAWANHSWHDLRQGMSDGLHSIGSAAKSATSGLVSGSRQLGGSMQNQTDQLTRQITSLFEQQPLIAGALAFAAGAALGAALPHTDQEDKLVGEQADALRKQAGRSAGELYEQGKEQVAGLYEEATSKAGELYDQTRESVADIARSADGVGATSSSRH